jgi:hypothetical protein
MDKKQYTIIEELWHDCTLMGYLRERKYQFSMSGTSYQAVNPLVPRPPGKTSPNTSYIYYYVELAAEDITALLVSVQYIFVTDKKLPIDGK